MEGCAVAHPGQRFAILLAALAAVGIVHARLRHQIAFISGIDEDSRAERVAILHHEFVHLGAGFSNAVVLPQPALLEQLHPGIPHHGAKDLLGHVRLVNPADLLAIARQLIMPAHAEIKLQGIPADHFLLTGIGPTKPAGDHPAQVPPRFQQRRIQTLASGRYRSDHAAGGAAVDHDVELVRCGEREPRKREQGAECLDIHAPIGALLAAMIAGAAAVLRFAATSRNSCRTMRSAVPRASTRITVPITNRRTFFRPK